MISRRLTYTLVVALKVWKWHYNKLIIRLIGFSFSHHLLKDFVIIIVHSDKDDNTIVTV